ncbi:hypothetical protein KR767_10240 [Luteibacter anthropi]|uniref:DUF2092 domain-containing protein n=1 Tax=Luteibacter anthropi TaxID=564369 RepID=A0A7X5UDQ2_9GAMM|nr:hypothetical protein [Luteibacter anthropi]NII08318.1 hypothetical protein [Luteibacter anthropi]URX64390.1 hypothetical protein KR767_10240 [Luteibacter anthropi]
MMKRTVLSLLSASLLFGSVTAQANSPAYVDSKEYKALVDPSRFNSNPSSAAANLLQDLSVRLSNLGFDKTISGGFSAGDRDTLAYYDTAGSCKLVNRGYTVRTRAGAHSDIQFKFRHVDEELSYWTDVTGAGKKASTKFETDVTPGSLVLSHSTKQTFTTTPANVSELIKQFPGASTLSDISSASLSKVAGVNVTQQEYTGPTSDIGQSTAEFTLTLWYIDGAANPALAELSFRVAADADKYFTTPVLTRSQTLNQAIGSIGNGWNIANDGGKTSWLYAYRSASYPNGFCQ